MGTPVVGTSTVIDGSNDGSDAARLTGLANLGVRFCRTGWYD